MSSIVRYIGPSYQNYRQLSKTIVSITAGKQGVRKGEPSLQKRELSKLAPIVFAYFYFSMIAHLNNMIQDKRF